MDVAATQYDIEIDLSKLKILFSFLSKENIEGHSENELGTSRTLSENHTTRPNGQNNFNNFFYLIKRVNT